MIKALIVFLFLVFCQSICLAQPPKQSLIPKVADSTYTENQPKSSSEKQYAMSTELELKYEYALKTVERDLQHTENVISLIEVFVSFIGVILAIFSIVGINEIRKINTIRNQLVDELKESKKNREAASEEIRILKEASKKEGKEILQILFCLSEGDRDQDANKFEEAINWYKQALDIRKDDTEIYIKLGLTFSRIGEYAKAITYLEEGLKAAPDNVTMLTALARAYRKSSQYDKAEEFYKKALVRDDNYIWAWSGYAQVHINFERWREAETALNKILRLEDSYHPYLNLGIVYLGLKEAENAKKHFLQAINKIDERLHQTRENPWLFAKKTIALIGMGQHSEAEKTLSELKHRDIGQDIYFSTKERLDFLEKITKSDYINDYRKILESLINKNHSMDNR